MLDFVSPHIGAAGNLARGALLNKHLTSTFLLYLGQQKASRFYGFGHRLYGFGQHGYMSSCATLTSLLVYNDVLHTFSRQVQYM